MGLIFFFFAFTALKMEAARFTETPAWHPTVPQFRTVPGCTLLISSHFPTVRDGNW